MNSSFELLYKIQVSGAQQLSDLAAAQRKVSLEAKYGKDAVASFETQLQGLKSSTSSTSEALKILAGVGNKVAMEMVGSTSAVDKMKQSLNELGREAEKTAKSIHSIPGIAWHRGGGGPPTAGIPGLAWRGGGGGGGRGGIIPNIRSALYGLQAGGLGVGISPFALSMGGLGGLAAGAGIGAIVGIAAKAAESARELQNLADRMGITTGQALHLSAAAQLVGVNISSMEQASRTLGVALEEPGEAGKRTADALTRLGVSITDADGKTRDMGSVLLETVDKLSHITDSSERAREAVEVFGRGGKEILPLIKNFQEASTQVDALGVHIDDLTEKRLTHLYSRLQSIKLLMEEGVRSIGSFIEKGLDQMDKAGGSMSAGPYGLFTGNTAQPINLGKLPAFAPIPVAGAGLLPKISHAALTAELNRQTGKSLDDQIEAARIAYENERARGESINANPKSTQEAISNEAKLVKKLREEYEKLEAAKKAAGKVSELPDALAALRDRAETVNMGTLGMISRQRSAFMRKFGTNATANSYFNVLQGGALSNIYTDAHIDAAREAAGNQRDMDRVMRSYSLTGPDGRPLSETNESLERSLQTGRRLIGLSNAAEISGLQRTASHTSTMARLAAGPGEEGTAANTAYQQRMQLASQIYNIESKNAELLSDADEQRIAKAKAYYDLVKEGDEARITREEAIATIAKQQRDDVAHLAEGAFQASIAGGGGGIGSFFKSQAQGYATKIVGNLAATTFPSLNKALGLPEGMLKDSSGKPSFMGKILAGTPFGMDPMKDLQDLPTKENTAATMQNTSMLQTLTSVIGGGATGAPASYSSGSDGSFFQTMSSLGMGPGGTAPFVSGGSTSSGLPSLLSIAHPMLSLPNLGSGPQSTGIGSKISNMLSGLGVIPSGRSLQGILTGGVDLGNGHGMALNTGQRIGAGLGLAGAEYGGISTALHGFGQGGGRGYLTGIAGLLASAGAFAGPAAPFLEAGAGVASLVGSFFQDPRKARQDQIDKSLIYDQYISPASHSYSYSTGGGGVDFGADGSMRSGAKQGNYTVNISAMDSHGVYAALQNNSQAFGNALQSALGSSGVAALSSEIAYHQAHP